MKKVQLERILQSLEPVPSPRPDLEQYGTPAGIAAEALYFAYSRGDIADKRVLDAGCGNGVLAIGAKLLGAATAVGVDVDPRAIETAEANARRAGVQVEWRTTEIGRVAERFDTVVMNPPFGSQTRHADLPFLDKAIAVAPVAYSFHNAVTEAYLLRRIEAAGARVTDRLPYEFPLPRTFRFQTKDVRRIAVVLLRIETAKG